MKKGYFRKIQFTIIPSDNPYYDYCIFCTCHGKSIQWMTNDSDIWDNIDNVSQPSKCHAARKECYLTAKKFYEELF